MPPERSMPTGALTLLHAVRRRRVLLDAAIAVTAGAVLAAAAAVAFKWTSLSPVSAVGMAGATGVVVSLLIYLSRRRARTLASMAVAIERIRPQCRNSLVTAEEISRHPERVRGWMAQCVLAQADAATQDLRLSDVVPPARTLGLCAAAILAVACIVALPVSRVASGVAATLARQAAAALPGGRALQVTVTIRPPAYASSQESTLRDPERIEVLEGSRLTFTAAGDGSRRLRFGTHSVGTLSSGQARDFVARESGYFALEDDTGGRRLVPLAVTRDRLPLVRVEQPARDLLLPDARRTIPLRVAASDDLGLRMLELRYTKVSGTGEQFEFEEGALPLRVERGSSREWRGEAQMVLEALALEPGDSLVYRAVARDSRPGDTGLAASDTYFVEIAGPGQVPLEGVDMPAEGERYALSQQMVVLRIERLRAREAGMARDKVSEESADIAAEQRAVRANFVFLLGGHVEDEEEEAEQSSEISEGRLQNTARRDVNAAIRQMTRAEQGLVASNTAVALPPARAAVEALQRAFGKGRYLLRALPGTGRIDPSRRLTGQLAAAATWRRDLLGEVPREGNAVRALLADLFAIELATVEPRRLEQLAERSLAIDATSGVWQDVSRRLLDLRDGGGSLENRRVALNAVLTTVQVEGGLGLLPRTTLAQPATRLRRAWEAGQR